MSTRNQQRVGATSLLLLAVAFVFAVIVSNQLFKGASLDLTENNLYTLSDGTKRIAASIDEPINLYFYFSNQATEGIPTLRDYANRIRELLQEIVDASDGKLRLNVIDPVPFSEEEDQATQFGLQGAQLGITPDPVFMGLAGTNSVGDEEIIPFFQPDEEATLEYDLAKLVSTLATTERNTIGLVSGVSMTGDFNPQMQRMEPPWVIYQQASQLFEIQDLGASFDRVPDEVNLLWIVQPKNLDAQTQYAIDQFVMVGGKALIFVDPMAAIDPASTEGMPQGMPPMGQGSDLPDLFAGWGINFSAMDVVTDARLALPISAGTGGRPIRHYGYLGISKEQMSVDDIVTMDLTSVNAAMAGNLSLADDSTLNIEPLLSSSESSSTLAATRFSFLPDPSTLQDGFVPGGVQQVVAARISGAMPSAFAEGNPTDSETDDTSAQHLAESTEPVNLIVVTDVDMLSDPMWVQVQNFFGQQLANPFASNGAFVLNALENLAGSSDLIAVRSRGTFARPFSRVDELRADAEAQFRETEQKLQQDLAETERRVGRTAIDERGLGQPAALT